MKNNRLGRCCLTDCLFCNHYEAKFCPAVDPPSRDATLSTRNKTSENKKLWFPRFMFLPSMTPPSRRAVYYTELSKGGIGCSVTLK